MFQSARFRLTAWYLVIIMAISIFFSAFIYIGATREFDRILRIQKMRLQHPEIHLKIIQGKPWAIESFPTPSQPDPQVEEEERLRVLESLLGVNIIILIISSLAGYFLAGRTLRPIKEMVDEQNRFITDASHELNTPLTALKTTLEVNMRDKNLTLEKAKDVLKSNLEEVGNLQLLSDDMIKLTQYQKLNGKKHFVSLQLSSVLQSAISKISSLARKKNINISTNISETHYIMGDEKNLVELFVILLDNAIKYSPQKKNIIIALKRIDGKVVIAVEDAGIGIKREDIPHNFDRFYRSDESRTKQKTPGYGLGLSIAKRIVDMHKGTISVESEVGHGTVFTVTFPADKNLV